MWAVATRTLLQLMAIAAAAQDAAVPPSSNWQLVRPSDPGDPTTAVLHVLANGRPGGRVGGEAVRLALRCRGEEMDGFILWSEREGLSLREASGGWPQNTEATAAVSIRIDDGELETAHWGVTPNDRGTLLPATLVGSFVARLLDAERLAVRVTPNARREIRATFEVGGLRALLEPLGDECRWR